ncbi:TIGR01777 family protein [Halorhodospira abdelmalekii]|uniref:TIGR01777 family oxidoreductase n=1 Tax=Halorhodospira abdelmalekii TaxID=421629 RepID=UPI00190534BF|nr:TIGR01777 family oxidoreductase [Halorhodospira abdelmalekii]MBK1735391.1 TIGR01777 family protein [Halorhodospira abdelmalekii]
MRILITGGSGFVGRALCARLHEQGHELLVVARRPHQAQANLPPRTEIRPAVEDFLSSRPEAIINLAGEPIAGKRWTPEQKQRLRDSRLTMTHACVELCKALDQPPQVLISASAMGYYGDRGEQSVDESSPPGSGFVAELCQEWEAAAQAAEPLGVRVARLRIGLVLDRDGGTLAKLLPVFKLGLGGPLGSGRQFMPWIHRTDLVRMILFLLAQESRSEALSEPLSGAFNAAAPAPVTNAEFTRVLARHLGRPAFFAVPGTLLRLLLGEMAEVLLTGADMRPQRLQQSGFTFTYPELDAALDEILAAPAKP